MNPFTPSPAPTSESRQPSIHSRPQQRHGASSSLSAILDHVIVSQEGELPYKRYTVESLLDKGAQLQADAVSRYFREEEKEFRAMKSMQEPTTQRGQSLVDNVAIYHLKNLEDVAIQETQTPTSVVVTTPTMAAGYRLSTSGSNDRTLNDEPHISRHQQFYIESRSQEEEEQQNQEEEEEEEHFQIHSCDRKRDHANIKSHVTEAAESQQQHTHNDKKYLHRILLKEEERKQQNQQHYEQQQQHDTRQSQSLSRLASLAEQPILRTSSNGVWSNLNRISRSNDPRGASDYLSRFWSRFKRSGLSSSSEQSSPSSSCSYFRKGEQQVIANTTSVSAQQQQRKEEDASNTLNGSQGSEHAKVTGGTRIRRRLRRFTRDAYKRSSAIDGSLGHPSIVNSSAQYRPVVGISVSTSTLQQPRPISSLSSSPPPPPPPLSLSAVSLIPPHHLHCPSDNKDVDNKFQLPNPQNDNNSTPLKSDSNLDVQVQLYQPSLTRDRWNHHFQTQLHLSTLESSIAPINRTNNSNNNTHHPHKLHRISKSSSHLTNNTLGTVTSDPHYPPNLHHRLSSSNSTCYRNSSAFLLDQESTRTWRGLFASVRQLSHSTSTTGSSAHSASSSSSTSSLSLKNEGETPRRTKFQRKQKPRKPVPVLSSPSLSDNNINRREIDEKYQQQQNHQPQLQDRPHAKEKHAMARKLSIVVVGDGAVGKSALTLRFLRDQFHDEYDPTIEDSYCKHIEVDGQEYTLDINDTAGQHEYRGHWNDQFLRSGDGFICVYSVASMSSFEELVGFRDQIWRAKDKESHQIPIIMIGNKCDLAQQGERKVPTDVGARFAEISNALFVEASAKTGLNINEMFIELVREIVRQRRQSGEEIEISSSSSEKFQSPPPIMGYSKNVTPPAPLQGPERDGRVKKTFLCCTIS